MTNCEIFFHALSRKKENDGSENTKLNRILNLFDLTALGVGSTLGLGVYVLAGSVAHDQAGPAVIISFMIAAIASAFASICYAEFASRVPRAGSAYVYSYVSVGEFVAFTIGWNLILEYVIGTSTMARGITVYLDALIDYKMRDFWRNLMPMNIDFLADYPDIISFTVVIILSIILALGVRESSSVHNVFTVINLITVSIAVIAGSMNADPHLWFISEKEIPRNFTNYSPGGGGFMPFGFSGVVNGAATCFYGFIGFDCLAAAGEEAKNPKRNVPLAIIFTCIISVVVYMAISAVLTMMLPYYYLDPNAPFTSAFQATGWIEVKWIVSIGAFSAMFSCLLGSLYALPRILYAMSSDGVLFKFMSKIHDKTKTPVIATLLGGFLSGILGAIFSLRQLVDMLSIGTLLAYSIVALCVMVLRYECYDDNEFEKLSAFDFCKKMILLKLIKAPTRTTSKFVKILSVAIMIISTVLSTLLSFFKLTPLNVSFITIFTIFLMIAIVLIYLQPTDKTIKLSFRTPLVPVIPTLSILINIYLMMQLNCATWIRFAVWLIAGYLIYFLYGIRNSVQIKNTRC